MADADAADEGHRGRTRADPRRRRDATISASEPKRLDIVRKHVPQHITQQDFERYEAAVREACATGEEAAVRSGPGAVRHRERPHAAGDVRPGARQPAVRRATRSSRASRRSLASQAPELPDAAADAATSGRRRVLAEWIASPDNPLTARVMVNRVWQYHFGRGIVRSTSDFGYQRHAADASRAARLAGRRVRRQRLAAQAAAPADRDVERLPDVERRPIRRPQAKRPGERPVLAVRPAAAGGRGDPRLDPGRQRQPQPGKMGGPSIYPHDPGARCWPASRGRAAAGGNRRPRSRPGAASTSTSSGRCSCRILAVVRRGRRRLRAARSASRRRSRRRRWRCSTASS